MEKSLKGRAQPQPKQEWSEDDKRILDALISSLINERFAGRLEFLKGIKVSSVIDWLKSLKEKGSKSFLG